MASIGAMCLVASSLLIGRFTAPERPASTIVRQTAIESAQQEAETAQAVKIRAKIIADAINNTIINPGELYSVNVLNGTIINNVLPSQSNGNSGYTYSYKNAYLLSDINVSGLDSTGNFLDGKWFGVASNDASGKIIVTPMIYDPRIMNFKTNKTGEPVIEAVLQATKVNFVPGSPGYEAYAFNPVGYQALVNDDGTQFKAGLVTRVG